jgi:hypothetical protein
LHVAFKVPCLYDFVTKLFTGSSHTKWRKCQCSQHWPRRGSSLVAVRHMADQMSRLLCPWAAYEQWALSAVQNLGWQV